MNLCQATRACLLMTHLVVKYYRPQLFVKPESFSSLFNAQTSMVFISTSLIVLINDIVAYALEKAGKL